MSEKRRRTTTSKKQAYTGKTIVLPRSQEGQPDSGPVLPDIPRVYDNPPPSQRSRGDRSGQAGRHAAYVSETAPARRAGGISFGGKRTRSVVAHPQRTPWQRVRRVLVLVLLIVVAIVGVGGGLLYTQVNAVAATTVVPEVRPNPPLGTPLAGGTTVLLIGVDERLDHPEEGVRSDTLILARLDAWGRWVNLLSIPRDTQVEIPNVGVNKINIAYGQGYARAEELYGPGTTPQQGGMALAAQTVETFLNLGGRGMRIDYTAQINFDGFVGIIDALGGITVDVPTYIIDYEYPTSDFGTMVVEFQPGPQRMDGATALIYARTRHADSDFGRAERQQQVINAMVAELQSKGKSGQLAALPGLLDSIKAQDDRPAPIITTMPFDRPDMMLGLAYLGSGLSTDRIGRTAISPDTVGLTEIGSDLIWDPDGVQAQVNQWLQPPAAPAEEATATQP